MKFQKPRVWAFSFLLCCYVPVLAQEKTAITGQVKDPQGNNLSSVTVSLLEAKDSSLKKVAITDAAGGFEFTIVAPGKYLVSYSAVGFEQQIVPAFELKAGQLHDLQPVVLRIASQQLKVVTVAASKPLVQVLADKTVFNVQNSISATGSTAFELLQKSPGVLIDNNDKITMKGKAGVRIYVDGKMMQLGPEDLAAWLKTINSNDIASIEMINNPGARYDASGNAGIINIRLRKNTALGANGSITAGLVQGITPKGNGAVNVNYRNNKVNLFSSAGVNHGRNEMLIEAPRLQKDTLYDQRLRLLSYNASYTAKGGMDYFINKQQTIGVMANASFNKEDWNSYGSTAIYDASANTYMKQLIATNKIPRRRTNLNANLNYRYADSSGLELNVDADYGLFRGRANSYQPNYYRDKNNTLLAEVITRNNTPTDIDIYTGKADLTIPLGKGKLGVGGKLSFVKTQNQLDFFNEKNGTVTKDPGRSYDFTYEENVQAAYTSYQRPMGTKWNLEAGLRIEQTHSKGVLVRADGVLQADNHVKKSYLDLFPHAVITWTVNKDNALNLSYGRRIDRPGYQDLNPFEMKLDELSYLKGNSFLRPQYIHNIELTHSWKNKITTSVSYSQVKDYATQTVDTLHNFTYAMSRNLAQQDIVHVAINAPLAISRWWNSFVNGWVNYQVFKGKVVDSYVDLSVMGYGIYNQHTFTLGKDYSAELTGWFNGPMATGPTWRSKANGAVDIGCQKLLFNKRATLKLTVTDIFHTAVPYRATNDFGGVDLRIRLNRESQTARVSFTWRFGNNKVKGVRQRQTGLEAEAQRIKQG
jgi:hypothetical protein